MNAAYNAIWCSYKEEKWVLQMQRDSIFHIDCIGAIFSYVSFWSIYYRKSYYMASEVLEYSVDHFFSSVILCLILVLNNMKVSKEWQNVSWVILTTQLMNMVLNIFVETVIHFLLNDYLMNRKFKRTAFRNLLQHYKISSLSYLLIKSINIFKKLIK